MKQEHGKSVEVAFTDAGAHGPAQLQLTVPHGMPRADIAKLIEKILVRDDLEKLRPRGCLSCLSGLDLRIRERFEHVLTIDV
jgi:hypothetical protein